MIKHLIINEILLQSRLHHLSKFLLLFFGFGAVSLSFISGANEINFLLPIFLLISIPLSTLHVASYIFREDQTSGRLEMLLTCYDSWQIITSKFVATSYHYLQSFAVILPIIALMIGADYMTTILLAGLATGLMLQSVALCILLASIQSYFCANNNYLSLLILPSLIPTIIICGLVYSYQLPAANISIIIGVDLIMVPLCICFSSYLITNIYNNLSSM